MQSPHFDEKAKFALVALASVATVGLFTLLASNEPDRFLKSSPSPPPLGLRRTPAEPVETVRPQQSGASVASSPAETPQADLGAVPGADMRAVPEEPAIEKAVARDTPVPAPRSKHRIGRVDAEATAAPGRRASVGKEARKRAFDDMLPNKKGAEPEEIRLDLPSDPLSDFIFGF